MVLRRTMRKRMQAKLQEVKEELRRRRHTTIGEQAEYLRAVVQGHLRYYGVPRNSPALTAFRWVIGRLWWKSLGRRSQRGRIPWERMVRIIRLALPRVRISIPIHPCRMWSGPKAGAGCGNSARPDLCGGRRVIGVPTATPALPVTMYRMPSPFRRRMKSRKTLPSISGIEEEVPHLRFDLRFGQFRVERPQARLFELASRPVQAQGRTQPLLGRHRPEDLSLLFAPVVGLHSTLAFYRRRSGMATPLLTPHSSHTCAKTLADRSHRFWPVRSFLVIYHHRDQAASSRAGAARVEGYSSVALIREHRGLPLVSFNERRINRYLSLNKGNRAGQPHIERHQEQHHAQAQEPSCCPSRTGRGPSATREHSANRAWLADYSERLARGVRVLCERTAGGAGVGVSSDSGRRPYSIDLTERAWARDGYQFVIVITNEARPIP